MNSGISRLSLILCVTATAAIQWTACKIHMPNSDASSRVKATKADYAPLPFDSFEGDTSKSDDGVFTPSSPSGTTAQVGKVIKDTSMWGNGHTCDLLKEMFVSVVASSTVKGALVYIVQTEACTFDGAPYFEGYVNASDLTVISNTNTADVGKDNGKDGGKGGKGGGDPFVPDSPGKPTPTPPGKPNPNPQPPTSNPLHPVPPPVVPPQGANGTCSELGHFALATAADVNGSDYCSYPDTMPADVHAQYDALKAKIDATPAGNQKNIWRMDLANMAMKYTTNCRLPGGSYRDSGRFKSGGEYALRLSAKIPDGGSVKIRVNHDGGISIRSIAVPGAVPYQEISYEKVFTKSELTAISTDLYSIRFPKFLPPNKVTSAKVLIQADVFADAAAQSNTVGSSCRHTFMLESPIVFDMTGSQGPLKTLSLGETNAKFDFSGNGQQRNTGWIAPGTALLVLDRNNNGIVDNGTELFGDSTPGVDGLAAMNGYEALKALDSNHDGMLTKNDALFTKLRLWFDQNGNGKTEDGELHTLAAEHVTKIGLKYRKSTGKPSTREVGQELFTNDVRYTAKFWGPTQCKSNGCNSYDVYFATSGSAVVDR